MLRSPSRAVERVLAVTVGLTSLGATCIPNPNDRPPGDMDVTPRAVGFADIEADVKAKCSTGSPACHGPTAATNMFKFSDDPMANYKVVKMFVTEATPAESPFLLKALGMGTPAHGGGPLL